MSFPKSRTKFTTMIESKNHFQSPDEKVKDLERCVHYWLGPLCYFSYFKTFHRTHPLLLSAFLDLQAISRDDTYANSKVTPLACLM